MEFAYGLAEVLLDDERIGYIEKGSFDLGGKKPEVTDINAEQVPDAPVLVIPQSNGTIAPTFNMIQLNYKNMKRLLGGEIVETGEAPSKKVLGWKAPTSLVSLEGKWTIKFASGQVLNIPRAMILANLGGKLTLTETSKIECELRVMKPLTEGDSSPYGMSDEGALDTLAAKKATGKETASVSGNSK